MGSVPSQDRPLAGRRVLVTRAREQAGALTERLAALGAQPIELPVIEIQPPADERPLLAALARLDDYDWIIFTSVNAVTSVFDRLAATGRDARALGRARVGAVGPATAEALVERGVRVDLVPPEALAESLLAQLPGEHVAGQRVLLPSADLARDTLLTGLAARGAIVERVVTYRTVPVKEVEPAALQLIRAGAIDAVTLMSGSAARNLVAALGHDLTGLERSAVVAIGPTTAQVAREVGLAVAAIAAEHTVPGLVAALMAVLAGHRPPGAEPSR